MKYDQLRRTEGHDVVRYCPFLIVEGHRPADTGVSPSTFKSLQNNKPALSC